jgi:hypothetical protein
MKNKRKASCAVFIERPFAEIQFFLEGIKERVRRHIDYSHIIIGDVEFRCDSTVRGNRNLGPCSSRDERAWKSSFTKWERKHTWMGWDIPFRSLCAPIEDRRPRDMIQYRGANWRQEPIWISFRERDFIIISLEAKII